MQTELIDELAQAGDSLVVVDFYAKWCAACKAIFPKYLQMAELHPDIIFLKCDFDEVRTLTFPSANSSHVPSIVGLMLITIP